jgi:molybdopterin-guanine dinucleotide biosynthesis protein A
MANTNEHQQAADARGGQGAGRPPLAVGILIGGKSRRMGRPKTWLPLADGLLLEHTVEVARCVTPNVLLLGRADVPDTLAQLPQLPDAPGIGGPLAGLVAAFRWAPDHRWIILPCDMPCLDEAALRLLLAGERPDCWAVQVKLPDRRYPEPLGALFGPRMGTLFEQAAREGRQAPWYAIRRARRHVIQVDEAQGRAWLGVNTPEEWAKVQRLLGLPA